MVAKSTQPIGIFDSGLGGLTVFREIERVLPSENLIYFGDTARVPYGSKSKNTIIRFSTENVLFLLKKRVKLIVVACNTSSGLALDYLKKIFSVPMVGVIDAGVRKALSVSRTGKIGVIATHSTIASGSYQRKLSQSKKKTRVYPKACPLFVPLVEEGLAGGEIAHKAVSLYLSGMRGNIDTLILGCTHYPLLKRALSRYLKGVYLVDSAKEVAAWTKAVLLENAILSDVRRVGKREFYVTDEPKAFAKKAKVFLRHTINNPTVAYV